MTVEAPPRIVAMGDSITFGVGDGVQWPDGTSGWAAHVARSLGATEYVNVAHNGVRARHLMESQVALVVGRSPDLVLMTVGGNDVLRGDFSPVEIRESLVRVFERVVRPDREVMIVSLDRLKAFKLLGKRVAGVMGRRVDEANAAILAACEGTPVRVVDGADVFGSLGPHAWHVDQMHPSQVGHRAIASRAVEALAERWTRVAEPTPAGPSPAWGTRAGWLAVYGAPWLMKRSMDLVPNLAEVVRAELRAERSGSVREFA